MQDCIKDRCLKAIANLKCNRMNGYYVETKQDARALVQTLISKAKTIGCGESRTLRECGIYEDLLVHPGFINPSADPATTEQKYRECFFADVYLSSANAITDDGSLYFVDGRSNRISAIAFGPSSVIIVVGYNKLCHNIQEATERIRNLAAPMNCKRLNKQTYCEQVGRCIVLDKDIGLGCNSADRICCSTLVCGYSRIAGRITVIFIGEELGF